MREEFRRILRFWLDRGVDGFRVDVAHGLIKADGLPDYTPPVEADSMGGDEPDVPYWGQPGVHDVYRDWHGILAEYDGDRALCAEAWRPTPDDTALWVRPDEMHQAFNFPYLTTEWDAAALRAVIDESLRAFAAVGAPEHVGAVEPRRRAPRVAPRADGREPAGSRHRPALAGQADRRPRPAPRARRDRPSCSRCPARPTSSRAKSSACPRSSTCPTTRARTRRGSAPPASATAVTAAACPCRGPRPSPRTASARPASRGCRSPRRGRRSPATCRTATRSSTLSLYRTLLAERRTHALGAGTLEWLDGFPADVLAFRNGNVTVVANIGDTAIPLPHGNVIAASEPIAGGVLPADTAVWLESD